MYIPKYFKAHEVVPQHIYGKFGERSFQFLDDRILRLADALREEFGSTVINTYAMGGDRNWSGLRTSDSPYYSPTSQHSFGRALDMIFTKVSAETVRDHIKNPSNHWCSIAGVDSITLEDDVSWLHIDIRNGAKGVNSFKP